MLRQVFMGLKNGISSIYRSVGNVSFIFILIAVEVGLFLAGNSFFPGWDQTYGQLILAYLAMTIIFLFWSKKRTKTMTGAPLSRSLFWFFVFFMITWAVMMALVLAGVVTPASDFDTSTLGQVLLIQICVVATSEELMFRGAMLDELSRGQKVTKFAIVGQAVVFALYHSWAYQIVWYDGSWETLNLSALFIAFLMGIVLGVIASKKEFGLSATIAVHAVFNLILLGAITIPSLYI